jgi:hypothetical protein
MTNLGTPVVPELANSTAGESTSATTGSGAEASLNKLAQVCTPLSSLVSPSERSEAILTDRALPLKRIIARLVGFWQAPTFRRHPKGAPMRAAKEKIYKIIANLTGGPIARIIDRSMALIPG